MDPGSPATRGRTTSNLIYLTNAKATTSNQGSRETINKGIISKEATISNKGSISSKVTTSSKGSISKASISKGSQADTSNKAIANSRKKVTPRGASKGNSTHSKAGSNINSRNTRSNSTSSRTSISNTHSSIIKMHTSKCQYPNQ